MTNSSLSLGRIAFICFLLTFFSIGLYAQQEPEPCEDPDNNGVGCFCETAGILCTPDQLDGFEFAMSDVANTGGLSGDLCPELPDGGFPHNVNFFAFIVWCETLTFDVLVTNCAPGTNTGTTIWPGPGHFPGRPSRLDRTGHRTGPCRSHDNSQRPFSMAYPRAAIPNGCFHA